MALELYRRKQQEKLDNIEVFTEKEEIITYIGFTSKNGSDNIRFGTKIEDTSNVMISSTDEGDRHRITFLKDAIFSVSAGILGSGSSGGCRIERYNSSDTKVVDVLGSAGPSGYGATSMVGKANAGDYFIVTAVTLNPSVDVNNNNIHFSMKATSLDKTKLGDL